MQYQSGDLLSRIVADIETLEHFFGRVIAPPAVALLIGLVLWLFVGIFHPRLALALVLFLAIAGIGLPILIRRLSRGLGEKIVTVRSELTVAIVDGVQGVAELLAFGQDLRHQQRVQFLNHELSALQEKMARIRVLSNTLLELSANMATLVVLVLAVPLVQQAQLDGMILPVLVLIVIASFEAVTPLPQASQSLGKSLEAARRLFEVIDVEPAVSDPVAPSPSPESYNLIVKDLCFRYGPRQPLVLDRINFEVPAGGSVAIVGPSGAGKSTLLNLLLRFWEYEWGEIILGGHELRSYHQSHLRQLISVVSQRTHLFNGTVRENLLIAQPDADNTDLVQAARQAQIHDFLQKLPQGYDTWIGEQGIGLSGGQRRRLAIARALLRDAPIMVFDEPTADLDPLTEQHVMQAIQRLAASKTTLIITHRLTGLESIDEILVLHSGRIIERGSHHTLLQTSCLYRRMWEIQNQVLRDRLD
jgi:thiol reductant ABC exporter CydC subunit